MSIRHITEILNYDFGAKTVRIRLVILADVQTGESVYVHCIHRRMVQAADDTATLLDEGLPGGRMIAAMKLVRPVGSTPDGELVRLRVEDSSEIDAVVPRASGFSVDRYHSILPSRSGETPFTSARFGPLAPRTAPYALGLSLTITGETFDRLIAVLRNHLSRFLYSIEGPDIVARDIEPLDLRGAAADIRGPYQKVLAAGITALKIRIHSYDVLTCDAPAECSDYVRLVSKVQQRRVNQELLLDGRTCLVNSWHSRGADFLIQRVSFSVA